MTIEVEKDDDKYRLAVNDEMTIYTAAEYKAALVENLEACQEMVIDLSGVTEMDSAGLQVLLMLKRHAQQLARDLHLVNHSQPVVEVLEQLQLSAHFGDPLVIPAEWGES